MDDPERDQDRHCEDETANESVANAAPDPTGRRQKRVSVEIGNSRGSGNGAWLGVHGERSFALSSTFAIISGSAEASFLAEMEGMVQPSHPRQGGSPGQYNRPRPPAPTPETAPRTSPGAATPAG